MHRNAVALTVLAGLAGTSIIALADPAPIRLTKVQIEAAAKAVQAKLPAVGKGQVAQCQKALDAYNANQSAPPLATAAACYRSAGSLGAAIQMWKQILERYPTAPEAKEAQHQLGPAYEAAAFWSDAADAYNTYAKKYAGEKDARDAEVRAVCTWEQLGVDEDAARGVKYLQSAWRRVTFDPAHLCDAIRPIPVPAP